MISKQVVHTLPPIVQLFNQALPQVMVWSSLIFTLKYTKDEFSLVFGECQQSLLLHFSAHKEWSSPETRKEDNLNDKDRNVLFIN